MIEFFKKGESSRVEEKRETVRSWRRGGFGEEGGFKDRVVNEVARVMGKMDWG